MDSTFVLFFKGYDISENQAFYVLFSNLIASLTVLFLIVTDLSKSLSKVDLLYLKKCTSIRSLFLIVGITGMINMHIDKILIPELLGGAYGLEQLAIYGANFKIGVLMAMFTQSFRLAFEPFFFKANAQTEDKTMYSKILTYFVLFGCLIFIGVTFFKDIINIVLTDEYEAGNVIIPIVLIAQLLSGIYFTLSVWYKITDKTIYGAYMGVIGSVVTLVLNMLLIPIMGLCRFCYIRVILFYGYGRIKRLLGSKTFRYFL